MPSERPGPKERAREKKPTYALKGDVKIGELLERARQQFYIDPNVIGVGIGPRRVSGETHHDELALIVYVTQKLPKEDLALVVPREFEGIGTDVVAPFGPGRAARGTGLLREPPKLR